MNLMIKVLLISSLFSNFTSCKLYKAINKSQQALANNKSLVEDNKKRSSRKAKSISYSSYREVNNQEQNNQNNLKESKKDNNLGIQKDGIVNTNPSVASDASEKHTNIQPQQVNNNSRETREARNIIQEISTSLEETDKITANLEETKSKLDKIKSTVDNARSYLNTARSTSESNKAIPALLHNLKEAIDKVNSSYALLNVCYTDAIAALKSSKDNFEHAQRKADQALQEALNNSNTIGYQYALYYNYMADAKEAMGRAKVSLETTKNKQKCLNSNMPQANAELEKLNKAYEAALQTTES
ncbi:immunogenic protein P37 (plasmid) [Borrelia sp. A-FGy1]|uniref:immunogenic protein P37 n=1 Tax=Borrelia sp. A-FGy1 TaxID=2608247 RepID=UPI0015F54D5C|nr:immunogenic protein P37 [Borrelia sp. A-FGy1]QMU99714.1 immunogenic protein P37 [Borrelia sp. A-FGy1]